jgi:hypothetical protein
MNASIIQKPESILTDLKQYEQKMRNAESINKKSSDDFDHAFLILRNKLIEEIFKNQSL